MRIVPSCRSKSASEAVWYSAAASLIAVEPVARPTARTAAWVIPVGPAARLFVPPHHPHAIAYLVQPGSCPSASSTLNRIRFFAFGVM